MHRGGSLTSSRQLSLPGFVLDESNLRGIDQSARLAVTQTDTEARLRSQYAVSYSSDKTHNFEDINSLIERLKTVPQGVETVSLRHTSTEDSGIEVTFSRTGEVNLSGFSQSPTFQFEFDRVFESVKNTIEPYGVFIRHFAFDKRIRSLLAVAIIAASMALTVFTTFYFYAKSVGVNIEDTSMIPTGNEYAKRLAEALRSTDINKKLDALLIERLAGFENVRDVLNSLGRDIKIDLLLIAILVGFLLVRKLFIRLYPRSMFMFGSNEKRYQDLKAKRQIWGIAVGVAFVVNIVAGLIVAFAMK
jgi:hypothetical protein